MLNQIRARFDEDMEFLYCLSTVKYRLSTFYETEYHYYLYMSIDYNNNYMIPNNQTK